MLKKNRRWPSVDFLSQNISKHLPQIQFQPPTYPISLFSPKLFTNFLFRTQFISISDSYLASFLFIYFIYFLFLGFGGLKASRALFFFSILHGSSALSAPFEFQSRKLHRSFTFWGVKEKTLKPCFTHTAFSRGKAH